MYTCENVRENLTYYFTDETTRSGRESIIANGLLARAIQHIVKDGEIICQPCWDFKEEMKREHCGG